MLRIKWSTWIGLSGRHAPDYADKTYAQQVDSFGDSINGLYGIGEKATSSSIDMVFNSEFLKDVHDKELVFVRCNAVVDILFIGDQDESHITNYAKRVDKRLSEVVCR